MFSDVRLYMCYRINDLYNTHGLHWYSVCILQLFSEIIHIYMCCECRLGIISAWSNHALFFLFDEAWILSKIKRLYSVQLWVLSVLFWFCLVSGSIFLAEVSWLLWSHYYCTSCVSSVFVFRCCCCKPNIVSLCKRVQNITTLYKTNFTADLQM